MYLFIFGLNKSTYVFSVCLVVRTKKDWIGNIFFSQNVKVLLDIDAQAEEENILTRESESICSH